MKKLVLTVLFVLALATISYSGILKKRFVLFEEAGRSAATPAEAGGQAITNPAGQAIANPAGQDIVNPL